MGVRGFYQTKTLSFIYMAVRKTGGFSALSRQELSPVERSLNAKGQVPVGMFVKAYRSYLLLRKKPGFGVA